ncbi:hypothetical protein KM92DES2_20405 [uncultured Desulfovibrio sp.]|uniref:Uncharacterized protein n=1 Tax=uncultured Desulfovibrio sp. TaxID=167968 RepID=A0A212KKU0_9BACT|nr:hypothetical protein KM92DES2_20405 [uncultured Desulfovibrio sp.]
MSVRATEFACNGDVIFAEKVLLLSTPKSASPHGARYAKNRFCTGGPDLLPEHIRLPE